MQALILAGGSGTRFWPLSRRSRPKQFLELEAGRSLIQATLGRLGPLMAPSSVWVCTTEALAPLVREQLPEVPAEQILVEPEGRNTAPAIAWALLHMPEETRRGVVAVLPADHRIADDDGFRSVLSAAGRVVRAEDRVMTLGVVPSRPETGFGYLELGETLDPKSGLRRVVRFTEKPDLATATEFVESGNYFWNAGIFVFRGDRFLELLEEHQPEIRRGLNLAFADSARTREIYAAVPSISVDHGVMENLRDLGTLPLDCGWSDLGSWEALWEISEHDEQGNVTRGNVVAIDSEDNLLVAEEGTLAVVGLRGVVVVKSGDAVLVVPRERSQDVREIVARLDTGER